MESAFTDWWATHGEWIARLVRRRYGGWRSGALVGQDFANEALQHVAVRLREVGVVVLGQALNIEGLVSTIAHNCAVRVWRTERAAGLVRAPRGRQAMTPGDELGTVPTPGASLDLQIDRGRTLGRAMRTVEAEHGHAGRQWIEVVVLLKVEGLTEQEVAVRIGKSLRSVQNYAHHGRIELRKALEAMGVNRVADLLD